LRKLILTILICALAATARADDLQCGYLLMSDTMENWAGQDVEVQVWQYMCWSSIDATAKDPGPDPAPGSGDTQPPAPPPPGGSPPPPPPSISIQSISDESPYVPKLTVSYNDSVAQVWLYKDGEQIGTFVPPETTFQLPSLDNMIASQTWFQVEATNADRSIVVTADAHLRRTDTVVRASNDFLLQWFQNDPAGGDYVISHYYGALGTEIYYADYDVPTVGARNGRVQHVQTEHALYWDNGSRPPDTSPSPYPTVFASSYTFTPYAGQSRWVLPRCDATGMTAALFPSIGSDSRIANCDPIAYFSVDGSPNGTASIDDINATTKWPPPPAFIIGNGSLTVQP
jgi:hypothetical protein